MGLAGNQQFQNSDLCVTFFGSAIVVIEIRDRHKQNPLFVGSPRAHLMLLSDSYRSTTFTT